jgi:hypothetical protein
MDYLQLFSLKRKSAIALLAIAFGAFAVGA